MQALRPLRPALGLVLLAFLVSGTAAASERRTPKLTLQGATVSANWREGWFTGSVKLRGTIGAPARLTAILRRVAGGSLPRRLDLTVRRAGRFRAELTLPARPLPGLYRLRLTGSSGIGALPTVERNVRVPAPAEGIVDRAIASAKRGGPRAPVLRGPRQVLFARFHFLLAPRAQRVQVDWRTPSYVSYSTTSMPYAPTIHTRVRSSNAPLEPGIWYCILSVGGKVAKRLVVRIE